MNIPLTIQIINTPVGSPIPDNEANIARLASLNPRPTDGTPIAITIPDIHWDQKGLHYNTRNNNGDTEFRFDTRILQLTLRQEIHISNSLSPCAKTIWLQHESRHSQDNEILMQRMDPELRRNPEFAFFLIKPTWQNIRLFSSVETTISEGNRRNF